MRRLRSKCWALRKLEAAEGVSALKEKRAPNFDLTLRFNRDAAATGKNTGVFEAPVFCSMNVSRRFASAWRTSVPSAAPRPPCETSRHVAEKQSRVRFGVPLDAIVNAC